jgi:hypothetical protein
MTRLKLLAYFIWVGVAFAAGWHFRDRDSMMDRHDAISLPSANVQSRSGPLTEWYHAYGRVGGPFSDAVGDGESAIEGREWLLLLNEASSAVDVQLTIFFPDAPSAETTLTVSGAGSVSYPIHEVRKLVPAATHFGLRVRSHGGPILVQATRGEFAPGDPVTRSMSSTMAHPGPLGGRETRWAYADALALESNDPLEEREWVAILNPSPDSTANVKITWNCSGRFWNRSGSHALTIPAERVQVTELSRLAAFPKNQLCGVSIDGSIPVVVNQIRRAYRRGEPMATALWVTLAAPLGNRPLQ